MNFEHMRCPVCGREFTPEDNIVVCPDCGTPHHRACWNELGHCANRVKHGSFTFEAPEAQPKPDEKTEADVPTVVCPTCGAKNPKVSLRCWSCGELLSEDDAGGFSPFKGILPERDEDEHAEAPDQHDDFGYRQWKSRYGDEPVGDITACEAAFFANRNPDYYLERFRRIAGGAKISWNWSAALFGPMWFFYRRMLLPGFAVLAASMLFGNFASFLTDILFKSFRPELYNAYMTLIDKFVNSMSAGAPDPAALMPLMRQLYTSPVFLASLVVSAAATLITAIVLGAFGNLIYYRHTVKNVKIARSFAATDAQTGLWLHSRGGVSVRNVVVPILAYFAVSLLTGFLM